MIKKVFKRVLLLIGIPCLIGVVLLLQGTFNLDDENNYNSTSNQNSQVENNNEITHTTTSEDALNFIISSNQSKEMKARDISFLVKKSSFKNEDIKIAEEHLIKQFKEKLYLQDILNEEIMLMNLYVALIVEEYSDSNRIKYFAYNFAANVEYTYRDERLDTEATSVPDNENEMDFVLSITDEKFKELQQRDLDKARELLRKYHWQTYRLSKVFVSLNQDDDNLSAQDKDVMMHLFNELEQLINETETFDFAFRDEVEILHIESLAKTSTALIDNTKKFMKSGLNKFYDGMVENLEFNMSSIKTLIDYLYPYDNYVDPIEEELLKD